jgi:hypothetical protein
MGKTELTTRKMNIVDYIQMMDANVHLYPEWGELSESEKTYTAAHLISFGSAEGLWDGDELVGVHGILQLGVGEAWMAVTPELRKNKGALLRHSIKNFKRLRDIDGYLKIFTGSPLSETFLKHLGFGKEPNAHVWTRKD